MTSGCRNWFSVYTFQHPLFFVWLQYPSSDHVWKLAGQTWLITPPAIIVRTFSGISSTLEDVLLRYVHREQTGCAWTPLTTQPDMEEIFLKCTTQVLKPPISILIQCLCTRYTFLSCWGDSEVSYRFALVCAYLIIFVEHISKSIGPKAIELHSNFIEG